MPDPDLQILPGKISELPPNKTDAEKAKAYREEIRPLLEQVGAIVERARRTDGLIIQFSMGADSFGREQVTGLNVTKPL